MAKKPQGQLSSFNRAKRLSNCEMAHGERLRKMDLAIRASEERARDAHMRKLYRQRELLISDDEAAEKQLRAAMKRASTRSKAHISLAPINLPPVEDEP